MRKKLIALMLALTTSIGLIGCSNNTENSTSPEATGGDNKITIWAWDPNLNIAVMNEAKELYQKENPDIEIEVVDFAKTDIEQKLHTLFASGTKENLPEIVLVEDYNAQKYIQSYPGAFEDLTGKIPHDKFAPYKVKIMTLDDKVYGVPFDSGVTGYFYRKDIIEEAGFTEKDLENISWDKFIEIGKVVKEKTGKPMISIDPNDLSLLRAMLSSTGSWYLDENNSPNVSNNEDLKKGISLLKQMLDTGVATTYSGWADYLKGFNSGAVAGTATGAWITPSVMQEESQKGLWKVAPMPRLYEDKGINASNLGGSSWYVLSNSDGKNEAVEFLNSVYTNEDFYQTILEKKGAIGTYLPGMTGEQYQKEIEFFGGQAIYSDFAKWMEEVPPMSYGIYTYEAESMIVNSFNDILGGADLEESLKSAEEQIKMQIQ